jgi:L-amino acid N-acyltransferase YncA
MIIRDSIPRDVSAIAAIYRPAVTHGLASFELAPPDEAEMARRRDQLLAAGFPHLVAEQDGTVLGYAYAGPYRARPAYRFTVENSIYVAPHHQGRGVGRRLLAALIARCEALGMRQMIAVIGDSANLASIRTHEAAGFHPVGTLPDIGWKHDRWVDCVLMIRPLGPGSAEPPPPGR